MLFNSLEFLLLFLPITLFVYFFLNRIRLTAASKAWLILASLYFYTYWNPKYLFLIIASMLINFAIGSALSGGEKQKLISSMSRRTFLIIGIAVNLGLLGYYKYTDFIIGNLNTVFNAGIDPRHIILPLAISFFTFQQIAFLVDSYSRKAREYDFLNYCIFVCFFPQLIAGPIVHHKEMMPQFESLRNKLPNYRHISMGLFILGMGLFKKVILADSFAYWATNGFEAASMLNLFEAWATTLSFSFQIYFDFSGYTDMAIGAAYMFNIKLPRNFNSPYKALNIQDFWRRWHITLSNWLRDYVYIPLGGNRASEPRILINFMIVFLLGGLWHGASWTFVVWGALHGLAMVALKIWKKFNLRMPRILAWFLTFIFINITWVFFRAKDLPDALLVIKSMCGLSKIYMPIFLANRLEFLLKYGVEFRAMFFEIDAEWGMVGMVFVCLAITVLAKNSLEFLSRFRPNTAHLIIALIFMISSIYIISNQGYSEFLYFQF